MHQLQWGICPYRTEGSPRHLSLKCSAVRASPHYGAAILSHHRPLEPLLSQSQGPLLALMTGIMMHTIKHQAALAHGNNEGQNSLCLTLWGRVYVHETLAQDKTVADMEEHPETSHLRHLARAASASWASSQSAMCKLHHLNSCLLAQMLMLLQELLVGFGLTPVGCPYNHSL